MKKILLSLGVVALSLGAFAQTNSDASGNNMTAGGFGYEFSYNKSANPSFTSKSINCLDSWHYAGSGLDSASYDTTAQAATFTTIGSTGNIRVLLTTSNCSTLAGARGTGLSGVDVSNVNNQKMTFVIEAPVNATFIVEALYGSGGAAGSKSDDGNGTIVWNPSVDLVTGTNTISLPYFPSHNGSDTDLAAASSGANGLFGLDLYFRLEGDNTTALPASTFLVSSIVIGDADVTGIFNAFETASFEIFPNPANGDVVNFSSELNNIIVMNSLGSVVFETASAKELNISSFENGMYILKSDEGSTKLVVE